MRHDNQLINNHLELTVNLAPIAPGTPQWTIRSLVAHTGGWLTGRLVFVAPIACRSVDGDRETFDVALTRQQVEQSPSIATDHPVSRQQEEEYSRYDGSPYDWDELG
ncbi:MAG TPA: hypothetical protein VLQ80_03375, partial [Candidatus Saccharimonadia bacterium]|nr:hypothetical protein [Candidatus Saccharimonadia bacterium]